MQAESFLDNATDLAPFTRVVKSRRTNLLMDRDRDVSEALVEDLLELIRWAPNHKRTWPWQVAVFTGASRGALGEACATDALAAGITDEAKLTKIRGKYNRSPVVLAVGQTGFRAAVEAVLNQTTGHQSVGLNGPNQSNELDEHKEGIDTHRVGEDRDAVAAGIQNLLLGATAAGLASYWGSATDPVGAELLSLCGFANTSRVNALIYLGWPASEQQPPVRPALPVTWLR
jgi:nitroreductase